MAQAENTRRVTATVTEDTYQRLQYWAEKHNISINQYLNEAVDMKIAYENKDYPLSTLEQERLNQLIDAEAVLSSNIKSLESVVISGFDSLLGLTRGDNYLLEHEDGELY
jgi:hypothetical protein